MLTSQPETGVSYQVVTLTLRDGREFERVVVVGGTLDLSACETFVASPFKGDDIVAIEVTHDRSGPPRLAKGVRREQSNNSLERSRDR